MDESNVYFRYYPTSKQQHYPTSCNRTFKNCEQELKWFVYEYVSVNQFKRDSFFTWFQMHYTMKSNLFGCSYSSYPQFSCLPLISVLTTTCLWRSCFYQKLFSFVYKDFIAVFVTVGVSIHTHSLVIKNPLKLVYFAVLVEHDPITVIV